MDDAQGKRIVFGAVYVMDEQVADPERVGPLRVVGPCSPTTRTNRCVDCSRACGQVWVVSLRNLERWTTTSTNLVRKKTAPPPGPEYPEF